MEPVVNGVKDSNAPDYYSYFSGKLIINAKEKETSAES